MKRRVYLTARNWFVLLLMLMTAAAASVFGIAAAADAGQPEGIPAASLDVDGNGSIETADAVLLARILAEDISVPEYANDDLNRDGILTLRDLNFLLRYLMGLDTVPPVIETTTTPETTTSTTETAGAEITTTTTAQPSTLEYNIDDICYNVDAFNYYAKKLKEDLMQDYNGVVLSYGLTNCFYESKYILALINEGYISDDVIRDVFSGVTFNDFYNYTVFVDDFLSFQQVTGCNIRFSSYACSQNYDVGVYIDSIEQNFMNNSLQAYIKNQLVDGNIDPYYLNKTSVQSFYCGFDNSRYPQFSHSDACEMYIDPFIDNLYRVANGYGKSR